MRAKSRVKASLWGIEDFQSSAALEYVALVRSSEEDDYYRDDSMTMKELVYKDCVRQNDGCGGTYSKVD